MKQANGPTPANVLTGTETHRGVSRGGARLGTAVNTSRATSTEEISTFPTGNVAPLRRFMGERA